MDNYTLVIILAALGFFVLAAILLVPVWIFLGKEEEVAKKWTVESLAKRSENPGSTDNDSDP